MVRQYRWIVVLATLAACGPNVSINEEPDAGVIIDGDAGPCIPFADDDLDGIDNGIEGCTSIPPRDTNGDGVPDYLERDSDGDGVLDGDEDRNGDGLVGTCDISCETTADCPEDHACSTPPGVCLSFLCMNGETNPRDPDSDDDGVAEADEGTAICNKPTEERPNGLERFEIVDSAGAVDSDGPDWQIALESNTVHGAAELWLPGYLESAYVFDQSEEEIRVAGFLVSRGVTPVESSAWEISGGGITAIKDAEGITDTILRSSGSRQISLDGDDTVVSTRAVVTTSISLTPAQVRDIVLVSLAHRLSPQVVVPPTNWASTERSQEFVVTYQTLYRPDLQQVVFMGAVATLQDFDDQQRLTTFAADDLANGTALTRSRNAVADECDPFLVDEELKADIIWVVDESGSMRDNREDVASHAASFFAKAKLAGLDFRMGVTDMNDESLGRFASDWSGPDDLFQFQYDIDDPSGGYPSDPTFEHGLDQGAAALTDRLPRSNEARTIRPDVALVLMYVTDEPANSLYDAGLGWGGGEPDFMERAAINGFVQTFVDQISAEGGIAHGIVGPEPYPGCDGGQGLGVGYGYVDVVAALGGQIGSVCQADIGPTLDVMIDDIVGLSSPIVLEWVPISLTMTVSRDGQRIERSQTLGWDYRPSSNSIIFNGMPFDPNSPSEVLVSYRRWADQVAID